MSASLIELYAFRAQLALLLVGRGNPHGPVVAFSAEFQGRPDRKYARLYRKIARLEAEHAAAWTPPGRQEENVR